MNTITLKGYIWAKHSTWKNAMDYTFFDGSDGQNEYFLSEGYMPVVAHTIEVEMPADFNPVQRKIESLQVEKVVLQRKFNERVKEINDQIQDLLCIEYSPSEELAGEQA